MGTDLPPRPLARHRRCRIRHPRIRRLVQPPAPPRRDPPRPTPVHNPRRPRSGLLPSQRHSRPGRDSINQASTEPGVIQQENQADRLRVPQLPVLPGPGAALRRKTQLGPVSHRHSPLNSEVPDYSAWSSSWTTILGTWNQKWLGHSPPGTESDVQNCTPATEVAVKEGSA